MSSILCVTETCARDPTPQGKHLVGDYRHYRSLCGSKYDFLVKRPSNLENKSRHRSWSLTFPPAAVVSYSGVNVTPIFFTKEGLLIKCLKMFKIYQIQACFGSINARYRLFLPYAQFQPLSSYRNTRVAVYIRLL